MNLRNRLERLERHPVELRDVRGMTLPEILVEVRQIKGYPPDVPPDEELMASIMEENRIEREQRACP